MAVPANHIPCRKCPSTDASKGKLEEIIGDYLATLDPDICVSDELYQIRLDHCSHCAGLSPDGTTCRYCGCLVRVRAKRIDRCCPSPNHGKW